MSTLRAGVAKAFRGLRTLAWFVGRMVGCRRWVGLCLALSAACWIVGSSVAWAWLSLGLAPGAVAAAWEWKSPISFERWMAGPARRRAWRRWARRNWGHLARQCGLSRPQPAVEKVRRHHGWERVERTVWMPPRLVSVTAEGSVLTLRIAASTGQTLAELEEGAERLSVAAGAHSFRTATAGPSEVDVCLTMADYLADPVDAAGPHPQTTPVGVCLGRTQQGTPWQLRIADRHTLVVGCSGSGKGSILWGVCGGLAHAVATDHVRLWGVDLKRGVELGMGRGLFTAVAYTPGDALTVLRRLLDVINARGEQMVGVSRLHVPHAGDPTHVLVVDELAALTAYGESSVCREANRLLGEILTQGRALGVIVIACVQDPRKEVVGLRGLFTQTLALRLRSASEVAMVLGDSTTRIAPAHRISPSKPGTAWMVEEDGSCTMVRANYWPDSLIQATARTCLSGVATEFAECTSPEARLEQARVEPAARKPRAPRHPRERRGDGKASGVDKRSGDAA